MIIKRSEEELHEVVDACENSDLSGMTYEEGVKATIAWIVGDSDETPVEIEE